MILKRRRFQLAGVAVLQQPIAVIINSSQHAYHFFKKHIRLDVEEVWLVALTSKLTVIESGMIFRGSVDQCQIHPREIIRFLCVHGASSFIMAHSHPSGDPLPSRQDLRVTRDLLKLSLLLQIPLMDHIVVAKNGYSSFKDRGFFRKRGAPIESLYRWDQQPESAAVLAEFF